jgi:hypothetical protein
MVRLAVIGGRDFEDYELMKSSLLPFKDKIQLIVSGGCGRDWKRNQPIPVVSADMLAERFADEFGIPKLAFDAEWDKYGKRAGFIRNQLIIDNCDAIMAFWDRKSKGTKDSIEKAHLQHKPVKEIYYNVINPDIFGQESHPRNWIVR